MTISTMFPPKFHASLQLQSEERVSVVYIAARPSCDRGTGYSETDVCKKVAHGAA